MKPSLDRVALVLVLGWFAAGCGDGAEGDEPASGSTVSRTPGCKRGVAWAGQRLERPQLSPGLTWWGNWCVGSQASPSGVVFEPMVWGDGFDGAQVAAAIPAESAYLLGFNEPNFFAQANLSATQAAALWPQVEAIATGRGLALVSPAVNFCGDDATGTGPCHDTNPVHYLEEFLAACQGCRVDFLAVHWYNCDGASLQGYLGEFKHLGSPIWLTEFACAYGGDTSAAGQEAYMREAVPILEADSDVFRYAWFSGSPIPQARLLTDQGELTALGQVYIGLPHGDACEL